MRKDDPFLKMTSEEYDTYMCNRYPFMFKERNLPMSQTCMCWGFDIGAGWRDLLDQACQKIEIVEHTQNVSTVFSQVKQKYAGIRLYHSPQPVNSTVVVNTIWFDVINDIIDLAESRSYHICEECSVPISHSIVDGHWIHALCISCYEKLIRSRNVENAEEHIKNVIERSDLIDSINFTLRRLKTEELHQITNLIKGSVQNPL